MFLSFFRAIKFSVQDVFRNIWLSLVTIIILVLALFTVNMLLIVKIVGDAAVGVINEKVDVNLFLSPDAKEEDINILKAKVESFEEVKEVRYISRAEALEDFSKKHVDNPEILDALKEIGKNPLTPTLVIKPKSMDNFDDLINKLYLLEDEIIESRNFANYKTLLNKIIAITTKVSDAAIVLSSIFIFITLLVVYNSVRVAIYTHRREITIMRLVGASNWFIQLPYIFSGVIYSIIGVAMIMLIFFPFLNLLQPYLEAFFVGYNVNLVTYFYENIFKIFGAQLLGTALINVFASLLAVRKYSRV